MLFRRIILPALITLARNPMAQKKVSDTAFTALNAARPALLNASRKAGKITRKVTENIKKN